MSGSAALRPVSTRLSDGRELLYFDDHPGVAHAGVDGRALEPVHLTGDVRWDALAAEWVIVAAHRQGRTHLPADDDCPLCPSRDGRHSEIPEPTYDVVVFENRFPSLAQSVAAPTPLDMGSLVPQLPARGRCEVMCYSPDHDVSLGTLPVRRLRTVLDAWSHRTAALSALDGTAYVFVFENRGAEIGVTLSHPHGQIYAYPFVPPIVQRMHDAVRRHRAEHGENLFGALLRAEQVAGTRVVLASKHWTVLVPAAARWPIEVHLYPNAPVADLRGLTDEVAADFCLVYRDLLGRLDRVFGVPLPYIAAWYQAPVLDPTDWWLHLRVLSIRRSAQKTKYLAGSESAMGAFINDITPERAAAMLRDAGGD